MHAALRTCRVSIDPIQTYDAHSLLDTQPHVSHVALCPLALKSDLFSHWCGPCAGEIVGFEVNHVPSSSSQDFGVGVANDVLAATKVSDMSNAVTKRLEHAFILSG
jgi:hypothetical protein